MQIRPLTLNDSGLQARECLACVSGLFVRWVELQTRVIFGNRFVPLIQLQRDSGQRKVSVGIVRCNFYRVLATQVRALQIARLNVEVSYIQIFHLALVHCLQLRAYRIYTM